VKYLSSRGLVIIFILGLLVGPSQSADLEKADLVVVEKSARKMILMKDDAQIREYKISLGDNSIGHKQQEGDERTPEGRYVIDWRNPSSQFHLSLHISYPNAEDKARAKEAGVSPGSDLFIHGRPNNFGGVSFLFEGKDWTDGCIAVTSEEIEEIWKLVDNGTAIDIRP